MPNRVLSAFRTAAEAGVGLLAACNRLRLPGTANPFNVGVHEPMREELTLQNLVVTGAIPAGLDGLYLKMGANPARPATRGHDWFLGDGMVHELAIEGGRALWYRNRWIGSRTAAAALGRPAAPGPRRGGSDTVKTNIVEIGGRIFAVVEAGSFPVELSRTLEQQLYNPFDGTLAGSFTGHPHRDPLTGATHAIAYDGRVWDSVRHVVVAPTGQVVRDMPVAIEHGPCIHDWPRTSSSGASCSTSCPRASTASATTVCSPAPAAGPTSPASERCSPPRRRPPRPSPRRRPTGARPVRAAADA